MNSSFHTVTPYPSPHSAKTNSLVYQKLCGVSLLYLVLFMGRSPGEGNGNPLQYSCLENSMDGGAWWATVHGVAKSGIWLSDFTFTIICCVPISLRTMREKKNNQPFSLGLNLSSASIRWTPTVSKHYAGWWIDGWKSCGWIALAISQAVNNAREVAPAMGWAVRGRRGCVLREWESMESIPFVSVVDLSRFTPGQESKGAGWSMEHFNTWWFVCCYSNCASLFCGYRNRLSQRRWLQFWRWEVWQGSEWVKIKELTGCVHSGGPVANLASSVFERLPTFLSSWSPLLFKPSNSELSFSPMTLFFFFCLLCVRTLGLTWIVWDNLPILRTAD